MSSTIDSSSASLGSTPDASRKIATVVLWVVVLAVGAYFTLTVVPTYFIWTEDAYGQYYWARAGYLFPHVVGGLVALVIGPFQFWPLIRNRYPKIHRINGRIYLISVFFAALAGLVLALISARGLIFGSGLFGLSVAWLLASGMAYASIRRRNFIQHKQWMIRSYVVTFAFVIFRLGNDVMGYLGIPVLDRVGLLSWASWALPLLIAEVFIQGRQVFASRTSSAS